MDDLKKNAIEHSLKKKYPTLEYLHINTVKGKIDDIHTLRFSIILNTDVIWGHNSASTFTALLESSQKNMDSNIKTYTKMVEEDLYDSAFISNQIFSKNPHSKVGYYSQLKRNFESGKSAIEEFREITQMENDVEPPHYGFMNHTTKYTLKLSLKTK